MACRDGCGDRASDGIAVGDSDPGHERGSGHHGQRLRRRAGRNAAVRFGAWHLIVERHGAFRADAAVSAPARGSADPGVDPAGDDFGGEPGFGVYRVSAGARTAIRCAVSHPPHAARVLLIQRLCIAGNDRCQAD